MFQDYLLYATDVEVRYTFRVLNLNELAQRSQSLHELSNERAILLAECILGSVLLSSIFEDEDRVNLRIQCGDHYTIASETTYTCETRGYVQFVEGSPVTADIDAGKSNLREQHLRSLRTRPGVAEASQGITSLKCYQFEELFNDHLDRSYQSETYAKVKSWVGKDGKLRAFAVLYQALPNLDPAVARELQVHLSNLPGLPELLEETDDPDSLVKKLIPHATRPIRSVKPTWKCSCSQESVERMVISLPEDEIADIIQKKEPLEIDCHYCSSHYTVTVDKIQAHLKNDKSEIVH